MYSVRFDFYRKGKRKNYSESVNLLNKISIKTLIRCNMLKIGDNILLDS